MSKHKHNPRNERPISLHPLKLQDALKKAMEVNPMTVLVVGDKVEVTKHSDGNQVGKRGRVAHVGSGYKAKTQPIDSVTATLPQPDIEPVYSLELDGGHELHGLHVDQLRKL